MLLALPLFSVLSLCACGDPTNAGAGAATGPSASANVPAPNSSSSSSPPSPRPTASPATEGVDLLKFELTSGVKSKDPVDKLTSAKPGQRVYGHVTARNRTSGTKRISLSFRVNDDERVMVDLDVEKSWSWRTWAYVTLRKDDKGELTVHVFDDHGAELGKESIPIK